MIRINQIKLNIDHSEADIERKIRKLLRLKPTDNFEYEIVRKSIDARKKENLLYIYSVNVKLIDISESEVLLKTDSHDIMSVVEKKYSFAPCNYNKESRVVIAGSGPAGLFCGLMLARNGYKPAIYERGAKVSERTAIVNKFWETGILDSSTNVQFGEGGAGTFSDGKLNSAIKEKSGRIRKVLETFVEFGAPEEILYLNKPHIGTDILAKVIENIRNEIIRLGGEVHFNSQITDIVTYENKVKSVQINNKDFVECDRLVLAIGHSARDTFEMLFDKGIPMEAKSFAVGMRVEHSQELIDFNAYKGIKNDSLPPADYKLTANTAKGYGVYSFCMCPGGYVVNASSEDGMLCVNGMSYSARDGINANSAIVVTVSPDDYGTESVLDGMKFQRKLEKAAFNLCNGAVPYQLNEDFALGRTSTSYGKIVPQIKGNAMPANLREILPEFICESVIDGMKSFDKMIRGVNDKGLHFNMPDAVFSGVESRTSSPIRIIRDDTLQNIKVKGLYPCGEGAGYAGGITSAAVDGIKVAEAIAENI